MRRAHDILENRTNYPNDLLEKSHPDDRYVRVIIPKPRLVITVVTSGVGTGENSFCYKTCQVIESRWVHCYRFNVPLWSNIKTRVSINFLDILYFDRNYNGSPRENLQDPQRTHTIYYQSIWLSLLAYHACERQRNILLSKLVRGSFNQIKIFLFIHTCTEVFTAFVATC